MVYEAPLRAIKMDELFDEFTAPHLPSGTNWVLIVAKVHSANQWLLRVPDFDRGVLRRLLKLALP